MLKLEHISKSYGKTQVLSDVCLELAPGETLALIGLSGSGKTTLLRITLGLIPFEQGYVKIKDQPMLSFRPEDWADQIGYVPQGGGLFPHLTGRENVSLVPRLRGWTRERIEARIEELRQLVGLESSLLDRHPQSISGGQQQRVAIMRAAMMDAPVLLLDEPMGALDPMIRHTLQEELKAIFRRLAKTVLIVTHDLSEAAYLAERIALLHQGRIIQSGRFEELVKNPADSFVEAFIRAHRPLEGLS